MPVDETEPADKIISLSDTEFRRRLHEGLEIPEWFSYPKVVEELRRAHPPKHEQGFTVFFTGLSGSGKSTIANALMVKLLEDGSRPVTLLDGDIVRKNLSSELDFSKEHRDLNIQRIGFVASEITKNRGIAICAPIAPYAKARRQVRDLITPMGGFMEVHVSTSIEVCESRDRKGLYAKARAGIIQGFTGVNDPLRSTGACRNCDRHAGLEPRPGRTPHPDHPRKTRLYPLNNCWSPLAYTDAGKRAPTSGVCGFFAGL